MTIGTLPALSSTPEPAPSDPIDLPDRYGMIVDGKCMAPDVPDGATVVADKTVPVRAGDLVIIYPRPEWVGPGQHPGMVKRLVIGPPPYVAFPFDEHPDSEALSVIMAEQINPVCGYTIRCDRIQAIHRVIGVFIPEGLQ